MGLWVIELHILNSFILKAMDWFLYDNDFRHERVKKNLRSIASVASVSKVFLNIVSEGCVRILRQLII